jgi:hypothetical protein
MRILCDGLGSDSSSRGSHGRTRHAKTGRRKPQRADIERAYSPSRKETCAVYLHPRRVGSIGKRCNETTFYPRRRKGYLRGRHESHMRCGGKELRNKYCRPAPKRNLKPFFQSSPMSSPTKPGSLSVGHAPTCAEDVAHQRINHQSSITAAAIFAHR